MTFHIGSVLAGVCMTLYGLHKVGTKVMDIDQGPLAILDDIRFERRLITRMQEFQEQAALNATESLPNENEQEETHDNSQAGYL